MHSVSKFLIHQNHYKGKSQKHTDKNHPELESIKEITHNEE